MTSDKTGMELADTKQIEDKNEEWQQEQQRVNQVVAVIESLIERKSEESIQLKDDIVDFRKNFWDDVTINFEDAVETAETYASMKQQAEILSERERSQLHMEKQLKVMLKLKQSPYFGRIDFVEAGYESQGAEQIYLGIGSLFDEDTQQYLIYDWRAPISSLYYDYGPGAVRYKTPEGTIDGEMMLKRQFMIRNSVIKSMFDAGVTIGDELLQEVLGKHSDAQMKTIVATIQQEQNQIIRNEKARLLIVQGAAGSGKTSAALQRAAYLLYRHRGQLSANQIVLFSPNPMFNSYIATVLPELGEENVEQTTYQQYLEHRLNQYYTVEDPFVQMEYMLTAKQDSNYAARKEAIRFKSSKDYMLKIDAFITELGTAGLLFKSISFRDDVLLSRDDISKQFYEIDPSISIPNRMRLLAAKLLKQLTLLSKQEREKEWVEEELELLDDEAFIDAYQALSQKGKFQENSFNDYESERDYLAAAIVQKQFKKIRRHVKTLRFLDVDTMYKKLIDRLELSKKAAEYTRAELDQGIMPYEDATPYLYFKEKLEGFQTNTKIKHIFIDEAQDYTPFQFHYLKRIFPNCKMTVLGDVNQTIFSHSTNDSGFKPLTQLFDQQDIQTFVLNKSYRSTFEIVSFTSQIIDGEQWIEPFQRSGPAPTITKLSVPGWTEQIKSRIDQLHADGHSSIAIICKTAEESEKVYKKLKSFVPALKLIEKETVTFEKGLAVLPVYLAKGVEFDAVIIKDASNERYGEESDRRLFYTACTRAMHELHIYYEAEPSPFLNIR